MVIFMSNEVIEIIKTISMCFGCITAILTVVTAIVTPLRRKLIGWIRNTSNTNGTADKLAKIEEMLESHISVDKEKWDLLVNLREASKASLRNSILCLCDNCFDKGSITSIEKLNLIDMYKEYHNLGGDTYCTDRYELALHLPEKNI